jgi:hypothetical protein
MVVAEKAGESLIRRLIHRAESGDTYLGRRASEPDGADIKGPGDASPIKVRGSDSI